MVPRTEARPRAPNSLPPCGPSRGLGTLLPSVLGPPLGSSLLSFLFPSPLLPGFCRLWLVQAQQVCLASCRRDEQLPLAEQITVRTQVRGGRVAHPSGPARAEGWHTLVPVICHKCVFPPRLTGRVTARRPTPAGLAGASQASLPPRLSLSLLPPSPSPRAWPGLPGTERSRPAAQTSGIDSLKLRCAGSRFPCGGIARWMEACTLGPSSGLGFKSQFCHFFAV